MTQTQNNYWNYVETVEHNRRSEAEQHRANLRAEQLRENELAEATRSHLANEANTREQIAASKYSAEVGAQGRVSSAEISSSASKEIAAENRALTKEQNEAERQFKAVQNNEDRYLKDKELGIRSAANEIAKAKNENDYKIAVDKLKDQVRQTDLKFKQYYQDWVKTGLNEINFGVDQLNKTFTNKMNRTTDFINNLIRNIPNYTEGKGVNATDIRNFINLWR